MMFNEKLAGASSAVASFMFMWAMAKQFFPHQFETYITNYTLKFVQLFHPYITITFHEHSGKRFRRSEAFLAIQSYLSGTCTEHAKRLKAETGQEGNNLTFSMDEHEEVSDEFQGVKVKWRSRKSKSSTGQSFSIYPAADESRYYKLVYHKSHRKIIIDHYLKHVMEQGKEIQIKKRQRKLYTNGSKNEWNHVPFKHPATFDTVALDPEKKNAIIQDLLSFSKSKDYYLKIGKPWKRGYLLYGPPGTGKSSMVAAIANLMDYDVYDLELTSVKDNTALRKLLIETNSKSIIVIEDIDCSLDLSGKRTKNDIKEDKEKSEEEKLKEMMSTSNNNESKVTLSGLLNFIDGLWSACGNERLIVFTTNYVEKLDPALIRRGRMDMHIELSYCGFEAFKVLARNYLGIEDHALFEDLKELIGMNDITPADVAENLMPKALGGIDNHQIDKCLKNLIQALKDCKSKDEVKEQIEDVDADMDCKSKDEVKGIKLQTNGKFMSTENLKQE